MSDLSRVEEEIRAVTELNAERDCLRQADRAGQLASLAEAEIRDLLTQLRILPC